MQMHLVPDLLPSIDISMGMDIYLGGRLIDPGAFVDSKTSQIAPRLRVQPFDKGERLVSLVLGNEGESKDRIVTPIYR